MKLLNNQDIESLSEACQISSQLHSLAMKSLAVDQSERTLAKYLEQQSNALSIQRWAYPTIIGSGIRTTILHADPTEKIISNGELILLDLGVHHKGFASDITRTWPASSNFSKEQKIIYEIVLAAQKLVIKSIKPKENLTSLHQLAKNFMHERLCELDVFKNTGLSIEVLFPHKLSHWIGHAVHDQSPYFSSNDQPIALEPGMCFTVEPGLYFKNYGTRFDGIGIRIEDVILVTESGCRVLSDAVKEIDEIEQIRTKILKY